VDETGILLIAIPAGVALGGLSTLLLLLKKRQKRDKELAEYFAHS
jgi:hypothetical protein